MTMVEGLMYGKICITTDATGIADYMTDGVDGFIVRADNAEALAQRMEIAIRRMDDLLPMRKAARACYEKYFSMKVFGDRLESELWKTIHTWKKETCEQ